MAGRNLTCLMIDDSKYDRQRLRRIANQTQLAIEFTEVQDLDSAISALRTTEYDIILMDQMLPDGEGTTVAELFKTHLGAAAPPIVMISGSTETIMPVKAKAAGCLGYIGKNDLTPQALEAVILETLWKTRAEPMRNSVSLAEHQDAVRNFAEESASELRSQLTIMLRLIARATDRHPQAAEDLRELSDVCNEIWSYLDVLCRIEATPASVANRVSGAIPAGCHPRPSSGSRRYSA
jgi:CheY-like chemotaxis protein